jgi:hypothetical protein
LITTCWIIAKLLNRCVSHQRRKKSGSVTHRGLAAEVRTSPFSVIVKGSGVPAATFSKSNKVACAAAGTTAAAITNAHADLTHNLICIDLSCCFGQYKPAERSLVAKTNFHDVRA